MSKPYLCYTCEDGEASTRGLVFDHACRDSRTCQGCGREFIHPDYIELLSPSVLVRPLRPDVKTKSGIIFPATMWRLWRIGEIVKVAPRDTYTCEKARQPGKFRVYVKPDVKVGDIILFHNNAVKSTMFGASKYFFVHWCDIEMVMPDINTVKPM